MANRLRIDPARVADLEQYINMQEEIRDWLAARGLTPLPPGVHRDSSEYYSESIRRGETYFACIGDEQVGALRLLMEDPIVWPGSRDDAFYLHSLVVIRSWSGRNVGRQMLEWAEDQSRLAGKDFLRLDCFAANPFLRTYYKAAGYADHGEIAARYPFGTLQLQRFEKALR